MLAIDNRYNIIRAGQTTTSDRKIRARYGERLNRFMAIDKANPRLTEQAL